MKKIIAVVGARPQFIKHFPFEIEAIKHFDLKTIHTGQHYDSNMSEVFFDQLGMRKPDYVLSLGGGSHGLQTGKMLIEIEEIVLKEKPDAIVVYGDTNSTLAGALVGSKLHIPIVHIEAGLRSYNKEMPEEVNRILTDHVSSLLLVPSEKSVNNLSKEGVTDNVVIVGDIMKDLLLYFKNNDLLERQTDIQDYCYVTLHRPYNVDDSERLTYILDNLVALNKKIIFPVHPRTRNKIKEFGIDLSSEKYKNIVCIDPQSYKSNLSYLYFSNALITDSGGMQKEAYWLEKPCVTIRTETEWVETLDKSANTLLFNDLKPLNDVLENKDIDFDSNLYGDGEAAFKICKEIKRILD